MNDQIQLLKAIIRVTSLQYLINIIFLIINSPERFFLAIAHTETPLSSAALSGLLSMAARLVAYLVVAAILWFFAGPLANFIGRSVVAGRRES